MFPLTILGQGEGGPTVPVDNANYGTPPLMFVPLGESNPEGVAANADATTHELSVRPEVQLLNTSMTAYDDMHIGVNNQLNNVQFSDINPATGTAYWYSTHGWENQFANHVEAGDKFGSRNRIFFPKCPQGGTVIADWAIGATYRGISPYQVFLDRFAAGKSLIETITGQTPQIAILFNQAINDANAATNAATWKTAAKALLNQIRADVGMPNLPILFLNFQSITGAPMSSFITKIDEIGNEMSNVHVVDSTPAAGHLIPDGIHWDYTGAKINADNLIDTYLANYSI